MKIEKINGIFIEDGHQMKKLFLKSQSYQKAISSMIIVCSDVMIFNRKERSVYLAKRRVKPMQGWWEIGGRRFAGETTIEAAVRNFTRETGLKIKPSRLKFVTQIEHIWKDRKEKPEKIGKHDIGFIFSINLNKKEINFVSQHLDPKEYTGKLEKFDKKRLIKEKVHPTMLEVYKKIFG